DFEVEVACPTQDATTSATPACGDGFALSWIDAASPTTVLKASASTTGPGSSFGVPIGFAGAGIAIDLFPNQERGDQSAMPALELLSLDATRGKEEYRWMTATKSAPLLSGWRKVHIQNRDGSVTLTYNGAGGADAVTATVGKLKRGLIGLSASTGAATES